MAYRDSERAVEREVVAKGGHGEDERAADGGAGSEGAQATLLEKIRDDMTLAEAEALACEVLKQVMEEKMTSVNVEVGKVTEAGFHMYTEAELNELVRRA